MRSWTSSLLGISLLGAVTASAPAAVYDWAYEGNVLPSGGMFFTEGDVPELSTDGNVLTLDYTIGTGSVDTWYHFPGDEPAVTSATWTVDLAFARPTAEGSYGNNGMNPASIEFYIGGSNGGRINFYLGQVGFGSLISDSSKLTIYDGTFTTVEVPGLDIRVLNTYRLVGTGGGAYKVYVNDIVTPVYSAATLTSSTTTPNFLYGQQRHTANSISDVDMQVDYIRINSTTAYDAAPIPEPTGMALFGTTALMLLRRRRHS